MWAAAVMASQTFTSGKRDEFCDLGIVDVQRPWTLRFHDRKRYALTRLLLPNAQFVFDSAEDQFLHRTAFAGSPTLELPVQRVRNIDRSSHISIVPYLWLNMESHYFINADQIQDLTPSA